MHVVPCMFADTPFSTTTCPSFCHSDSLLGFAVKMDQKIRIDTDQQWPVKQCDRCDPSHNHQLSFESLVQVVSSMSNLRKSIKISCYYMQAETSVASHRNIKITVISLRTRICHPHHNLACRNWFSVQNRIFNPLTHWIRVIKSSNITKHGKKNQKNPCHINVCQTPEGQRS